MNDLIPNAFFAGCVLATLGLVRLCEWLRPPPAPAARNSGEGTPRAASVRHEEAAR